MLTRLLERADLAALYDRLEVDDRLEAGAARRFKSQRNARFTQGVTAGGARL